MPDETPVVATALTAELETWRKRMFRRLVPARDHFPALHQLATGAEPPAGWAVRDYPPIRTFLIQALDHAEQVRGSGQPVDAYSPPVLRCIFGLTDETMNATVKERQEAASALIPDAYTHYEMTEPEVRGPQVDALIAAVHAWHEARHAAISSQGRKAEGTRPLFGRDADLTWLGQTRLRLRDTGGLFGIWGLEGIGKTALAERFAWTIGAERTATIRVGQAGRYAEDLRAVLTRAGHPVPDAGTEEYEAAFRRHVASLGDLWLLILDGVTSPEDLDRLGVENARIPVLVVADERFTAGHGYSRSGVDQQGSGELAWRHIAPLDRNASLLLLMQHLAEPSPIRRDEQDALGELAALMGGHAATLEAVSRLLPDLSASDIDELIVHVRGTPVDSLAALTRFTGDRELRAVAKPLSWIIRTKVAQLSDDPVARTTLAVLVSCGDAGRLPRDMADAVVTEMLGRRPWARELDFAYDRLAQLGLITRHQGELSTERLVCQLARYEIHDQLTAALLAYERVAAQPVDTSTSRFTPLNHLREEYAAASELGHPRGIPFSRAANSRFLRVGPWDFYYFGHYRTNDAGQRTVRLYRVVSRDGIFRFTGPDNGWIPVDNPGDQWIVDQMIEAYWSQIMKIYVVGLANEFGDDQSQWPAEVLDVLEWYG